MFDFTRNNEKKIALLFLGLWLLSLLIFSSNGLWVDIYRDNGIYLYSGQEILRGGAPYKDAIGLKMPLGSFINAGAIFLGRIFSVSDLTSARLCSLILGSLAVPLTMLLAWKLLKSMSLAMLSGFLFLLFIPFGYHSAMGGQPKVYAIAFSLLSTIALIDGRWWLAGLAGGLAVSTWQPMVIYPILAVCLPWFQKANLKKKLLSSLMAALMVLMPVAILILYFYSKDALVDAWQVLFVLPVKFLERDTPSIFFHFRQPIAIVGKYYPYALIVVAVGFGSSMYFLLRGLFAPSSILAPLLKRGAGFIVSWWFWVFWSIFDFQGTPDFFPLIFYCPIWALFLIKYEVLPFSTESPLVEIDTKLLVVLLTALLVTALVGFKAQFGRSILANKLATINRVEKMLAPSDKILVIGQPDILFLLQRQNICPYIILISGIDRFVHNIFPGGMNGLVQRLEGERPKLVYFKEVDGKHVAPLLNWRQRYYRPVDLSYEGEYFYLRKEASKTSG